MKVLCAMCSHVASADMRVISFGSCQDYRYRSKDRNLHSTTEKMHSRPCRTAEGHILTA